MDLKKIIADLSILEVKGSSNKAINQIQIDSRKIKENDLFVALKGVSVDGHQFIEKAVKNGATTIVCSEYSDLPKQGEEMDSSNLTYVVVKDTAKALGHLAAAFYDHPSTKLDLIGVTGTNGKTTIATLLYQLFGLLGEKCGLISTIRYMIGEQEETSTHTTPNALRINELLAQMVEEGCTKCFAEVSSHAIHQDRIEGLVFKGGIFTNLSHDHLDYHETFDEYLKVKKRFFDDLPKSAFALSNLDDKRGKVMLQNTVASAKTFAIKSMADYKLRIVENSMTGLVLNFDGSEVYSLLIGTFNASNLLAVYATSRELGYEKDESLQALSQLLPADGRFDFVLSPKDKKMGIVDYAHTPDALEKILKTLDVLKTSGQQLITVVGCGGDRDKTKRPVMAKVAAAWSDCLILTSDNPRTEEPKTIIQDMEAGLHRSEGSAKVLSITDRKEAIKTACMLAQPGDLILVAGKGHERYQEINGERFPFDDKAILKEIFQT